LCAWVCLVHCCIYPPCNCLSSQQVYPQANRQPDKSFFYQLEGPQFSTRAESQLYRSWQASCINMSCLPEAKLAREAELGYAMICMSTDYDSWHSTNESVSVDMVMGHMRANGENAKTVVAAVLNALGSDTAKIRKIREGRRWEGQTKWAAEMTKPEGRNRETVMGLAWLFPDHFGAENV